MIKSLKYPAELGIKSHIISGQNHICDILVQLQWHSCLNHSTKIHEGTYTEDKWLEGIQKQSETSLSICKRREVKVGGDGLLWVESEKMKCVNGYEVIFFDPHQHVWFEGWRREHLHQSQIGALMKVSRGSALSKGTRPRRRRHCPKGWSVDRWDTRPDQVWWW